MVNRYTKLNSAHSVPTATVAFSLLCLLGSSPKTVFAQTPTPTVSSPPAATPPAPANGPGPATQPPPPPGTTLPAPTQPAPVTPAAPAAATPPPNYNIQTTGLIDAYYLYQFSNPKFNGLTNNLGTPFPTVRQNAPTLNLAELNVFENPRPNNFGFKATLIAGDYADLNHFGFTPYLPGASFTTPGTGESRFKNIMQLYGTYAFGGNGAGVDFGKFYTPFGYEVTEANGDYNETRSLAYLLVPTYHAGARIYTPVPGVAGLTATFYLVNALFNDQRVGVQDDNKTPAFIGQLNYTDPKGKFVLISELGLGKDKYNYNLGSASDTNSREVVNDNNFTYNFNANVLAGLDYTYVQANPNNSNPSDPKETAQGYAVYFRDQYTPKQALALRVSGQDDKVNTYPGEAGIANFRPYEFTATYEYKVTTAFTTRLEYRHDNINGKGYGTGSAIGFAGGNGAVEHSNQDLVLVAGLYTF